MECIIHNFIIDLPLDTKLELFKIFFHVPHKEFNKTEQFTIFMNCFWNQTYFNCTHNIL